MKNNTNKLFIVCGIPFSGKTVLSKELAKVRGFIRVDLDEVKFDLYGRDVKDDDLEQKDWDLIYQEMYKKIRNLLKEGKTVVHDTGNFTKYERNLVGEIADKLGIDSYTVFVDTPKKIALQRMIENRRNNQRFDVTDANFESAVEEMEPPQKDENLLVFHYDEDMGKWIRELRV